VLNLMCSIADVYGVSGPVLTFRQCHEGAEQTGADQTALSPSRPTDDARTNLYFTRSSAVTERSRDAPCRWKSYCHSRSLKVNSKWHWWV